MVRNKIAAILAAATILSVSAVSADALIQTWAA